MSGLCDTLALGFSKGSGFQIYNWCGNCGFGELHTLHCVGVHWDDLNDLVWDSDVTWDTGDVITWDTDDNILWEKRMIWQAADQVGGH